MRIRNRTKAILVLFVATAIVALTVPAEAGLILHYPMNTASWPDVGPTTSAPMEDMSPTQENDALAHASCVPAADRFGDPTGALQTGSGDTIHIDNTNGVDTTATGEFSIAGWFKGTDSGYFFDQESPRFVLSVEISTGLGVHYDGGWYTTGNTTPQDGEWHHMAFVVDNDTTDSFFSIYVDGTAIDVDPGTVGVQTTLTMTGKGIANLTQQTTNYRQRFLGRFAGGTNLEGVFDDIRIYDHALTAQEVTALTLVPEPSAFALAALGLLGLLGFGRRKRR